MGKRGCAGELKKKEHTLSRRLAIYATPWRLAHAIGGCFNVDVFSFFFPFFLPGLGVEQPTGHAPLELAPPVEEAGGANEADPKKKKADPKAERKATRERNERERARRRLVHETAVHCWLAHGEVCLEKEQKNQKKRFPTRNHLLPTCPRLP